MKSTNLTSINLLFSRNYCLNNETWSVCKIGHCVAWRQILKFLIYNQSKCMSNYENFYTQNINVPFYIFYKKLQIQSNCIKNCSIKWSHDTTSYTHAVGPELNMPPIQTKRLKIYSILYIYINITKCDINHQITIKLSTIL